MKLGVHCMGLLGYEFEEGLARAEALGVEAIDVKCAGYFKYADPDELLASEAARSRWLDAFLRHGLEIGTIDAVGEPLSPDPDRAKEYSRQFRQACKLAETIGVKTLSVIGGLPQGAPGDQSPCWVVVAFPDAHAGYNARMYEWQWEERAIPFWQEHAKIAEDHGCRLAFMMVQGDLVYNPTTLMKLRTAVGSPSIGCYFDPSHLAWQGIDVVQALRYLGDHVFGFGAKDVEVQHDYVRTHGILDPKPFDRPAERAWLFRTVGYGHGESWWRRLVSTLRMIGYDGVLSIKTEDTLIELDEQVEKAVAFLRPLLLERPVGRQWWNYVEAGEAEPD